MNPLLKNQNNIFEMLSKFNEFKKSIQDKDINKLYNDAIKSGKYSQSQIEQAKQMAEQFKGLLK